jgi:hypothetical protein
LKAQSRWAILLVFTSAVLFGCAAGTQSNLNTQSVTTAVEVPTLKVALDCGTCEVKATIPSLVVEGYNQAAIKSGANVSAAKEATLTIKEYIARGDAARLLAGAFAGKDEIKAVITYQGKSFSVEDYYRNAWLGIDTLAKNIGEMAYDRLK